MNQSRICNRCMAVIYVKYENFLKCYDYGHNVTEM